MSKGAMAAAAVATGLQDLVQARLTSLDIAGPHITLVTAFQLPVHTHLMTVILYQLHQVGLERDNDILTAY